MIICYYYSNQFLTISLVTSSISLRPLCHHPNLSLSKDVKNLNSLYFVTTVV